MANSETLQDFESIRARLAEIVDAVSDDDLPLDDALDLYEEAVTLGMRVSEVLEDGIVVNDSALDQATDAAGEDGAQAATPDAAPADASAPEAAPASPSSETSAAE